MEGQRSQVYANNGTFAAVTEPFSGPAVVRQLENCTYCPKMCRHACPVATTAGREPWTPQAKMDTLNQLRLGRKAWTQEGTESLWACTACRHCTVYCEHDNEPGPVLFAGRAEAIAKGVGPASLENYQERFAQRQERLRARVQAEWSSEGEPGIATGFGGAVAKRRTTGRMSAVTPLGQPSDAPTPPEMPPVAALASEIGYLPGCDTLDKNATTVAAAMAVWKAMGQSVRLVTNATCGGYPLLAAGRPAAFRQHAAQVAVALRGLKTVIVGCSACRFVMRGHYAAEGVSLPAEILSVPEFMARHQARLPQPDREPARPDAPPGETGGRPVRTKKSVYYHDPCNLARAAGVTDEPRAVLRTLANVREFAWNRTDTECCGGSGLLPKTDPATADAMAKRRLAEIHARGGGTVVTACGTCSFMLKRNAPASVDVVDLPTAVAQLGGVAFTEPALPIDDDDD